LSPQHFPASFKPTVAYLKKPSTVLLASTLMLMSAPSVFADPPGAGWSMAWSDEFSGSSLNTSNWSVGTGARRDATNTANALTVQDGHLRIKTYTEGGKHYTGWIGSNGKYENCFGYWEARLRFNSTVGMWSAFWLQPYGINNVGNPAANGTEIDIVEHRRQDSGGADLRNKASINVHWDGYGADHKSVGATVNNPGANTASLQGNWHTYGLLWDHDRYRFYIDGVEVWTTTAATSQVRQWIYLTSEVENNAWAGPIPSGGYGDRNNSTTWMDVDYVRFYQRPERTINSHFGYRMGPWRQSGQTSWSSTGGRGDGAGTRLNPSTTSGSRVEQTAVGLLPNTPYVVHGWGSVGSRNWPDIRIGARNYGGAETYTSLWSSAFTEAERLFTTGASNTRADVFAWVPTQWGDCYADDLTVRRAGRMTNGGFEQGDGAHWSFSGDAFTHDWASSFKRSGEFAMRLNSSSSARSAEQTIRALKPSTTYRFSSWVKGNGQPVRLGVKNHGSTESFTTVTGAGGNWTRGVHVFTTGASDTSATVFAAIPTGSNVAAVDLDDFLLVETLPPEWSASTVGAPYPVEAGASDGRLVVRGAGNNLGTASDALAFVHQALQGAGKITARLNSFESHHDRAKAGVMLRASTAADAPFAMVHWLPEGQVEFIWRNTAGTASSYVWASAATAWPPRLRLVRVADLIHAHYSTDGTNWIQVGAAQPVNLPEIALAGLAVTSHDPAVSAEAVFSNVSFSGDRDNDGLPDDYETHTGVYVSSTDSGTDPDNPDTDGDGFLDGFEVASGMTPLVPNHELIWQPGTTPGGSGTWDPVAANWSVGSGKSPWILGKTAMFGGVAGTVTLSGGLPDVGGLIFTLPSYQLAGTALSFAAEAAVTLPGSGTTTIAAPWSGNSAVAVTGGGRLDLRGDNRGFAGTITVTGNSELRPYDASTALASGHELGKETNTVVITAGSWLRWFNVQGTPVYAANLHLGGNGNGNGALNNDAGSGSPVRTVTWNGSITLDANATIGTQNEGAFAINGPIDGSDFTLTVQQAAASTTLNGPVEVAGITKTGGGTLVFGPASSVTAPLLTYQAGTITFDPAAALDLGALQLNANLPMALAADLTLDFPVTGAATIQKTGPATLTLAAANSFGPAAGTFALGSAQNQVGALRLAHPQAAGNHARIALNSDQGGVSRLELSGGHLFPLHVDTVGRNTAAGHVALRNVAGHNTLGGGVSIVATGGAYHLEALSGSSLTISGKVGTTLNNQSPRDLRFIGDGDIVLLGGLEDSATATPTRLAVTKLGSGTLRVAGTSTHQAATHVQAGTLRVDGAFTHSVVNVAAAGVLTGSGVLPAATVAGTLALTAGQTLTIHGLLALDNATLALTGVPAGPGPVILASYGSRSGNFGTITGIPAAWSIEPDFNNGTAIALVPDGFSSWAGQNAGGQGPGGDFDNDGIPNLVEYALLTNPDGPDGFPGTFENGVLSFTKRPEAVASGDVTYAIETSASLNGDSWNVITPDANHQTMISYTLPAVQGRIFARLVVTALNP
jgi:autotransporter-associated beta strand protein